MAKFTDQEYAEYMLANYVLGYIDTAIFIAANLFEKYIQSIVGKEKKFVDAKIYRKKYFSKENYWKQDVLYQHKNLEKSDIEESLKKFAYLRNDFIHGLDDNQIIDRKNQIREFILYIYFSFHKDQEYSDLYLLKPTINDLLVQDYKVKEITERMISRLDNLKHKNLESFKAISFQDFNNLFRMRESMSVLQEIIAKEVSEVGLEKTILSPVDTTSAYIWMPFVDQDFTDNKNKHNTKRNNLTMGSVSILATPLNFRIYIDFGGGDFEYRMAFQEFLSQQSMIEYLVELINSEEFPLSIFDIRWYSFIVCQQNLLDVVKENQLKYLIEEAVEAIQSEEDSHQIITSGYNRIGFIIPASNIDKNTILRLFKKIAHFYYEFLKYKFKDDPDIDMLSESQRLLEFR